MTYVLSVGGSMVNLDDEATIEAMAREFVSGLSGTTYATLTTTHGGSVSLLTDSTQSTPVEPVGEADEQSE